MGDYLRLADRYKVVDWTAEVKMGPGLSIPLKISDVSGTGFQARSWGNIPDGVIQVAIKIDGEEVFNLVCRCLWSNTKACGFTLVEQNWDWKDHVESLEGRFEKVA